MKLYFHKRFIKDLQRLSKKEQTRTKERLKIFIDNPFDTRLRNHPLKGKFDGYRSIDIKPDLRAVYYVVSDKEVRFITVGSHSQLFR